MARKSTTKSAENITATTEESVVAVDINADTKVTTKKVKVSESVVEEPLSDSDEIEVVSIIPNVSYKDSKTNDMYEWDEVGHIEYMTVDTIKNMWRNHKAYFRNMWLKPNDDRVIKQLGLKNIYEKYEFLMDESNYTRKNINKINEILSDSSTTNGLKLSVCNKIKDSVISGNISDVVVIKSLEKQLDLDLISFL